VAPAQEVRIYPQASTTPRDLPLLLEPPRKRIPEPTTAQDLIFVLQDIYVETRGEFKAQKLVIDADLGLDGLIRLICGINTTCASTLLSSLCALSPALLSSPLALRLRPGSSHGVVMPALFVDNEWVDGRPMARDEKGSSASTDGSTDRGADIAKACPCS
jgi:hypothetical protein